MMITCPPHELKGGAFTGTLFKAEKDGETKRHANAVLFFLNQYGKMFETGMRGGRTEMEKKARQSNVELLRILAMLIIIGHHFALHGGLSGCTDVPFYNRIWIQFLLLGGKLGVSIFILISGYFLIQSPGLKGARLLKLWLQVFTWSIIWYGVYLALMHRYTGENQFLVSDFVKCFFPLIFQSWWFASTYFAMVLFSPFLNRFLTSLSRRQYLRLLMLMTACWGVVPMIFGKAFEASHLLWFFYLYSISGYIRLYGVKDKISLTGGKCILLAFLAEFLVLFLVDRTRIIRLNLLHYSAEYQFSTGEEGEQRFLLLITFVSVLLLIGFLKCSMKPKKIINSVSAATFGIYLIHDSLYLRPAIWTLLIGTRGEAAASGLLFIPYSIAVAAAVFLACMAAEMIRKIILEKHYLSALEMAGLLIEQKLRKWEDSFDKEDSEV